MTNFLKKHYFKRLLSSTALIGALFFSNTLSVSAEEIEETTPVEDQTVEVQSTEDDQDTYEKENTDDSVEEVDDLSDVEENASTDGTNETEDSEETEKETGDAEDIENDDQTDEEDTDEESFESKKPAEEAGNSEDEDESVIDEESESEDADLTKEENSEDEDTSSEEEIAESEEISKDAEENSDEDVEEDTEEDTEKDQEEDKEKDKDKEEDKDKEVDEETDESTQTFQATLSADAQQLFAPMMANLSSARVAQINEGPVERITGASRDDIAATISKRGWQSSDVVYLVNGFKEADALTGAPLASTQDAPILFTRDNVLPAVTLNEMKRLGASKVIILGGSTSVPQHIVDVLENSNLRVDRIDGTDRYDLASNIAKNVMKEEGTGRDAFLVNGDAYADAISIAPVAGNKRLPIFLTRANQLHSTVRSAIPYVNSWTIIGGQVSISNKVTTEMEDAGAEVAKRIDGSNRYDVNRNIINHYGNNKDHAYVASGEVVSDALATSTLAGKEKANIVLVKDDNVGNLHTQTDFIKNKHGVEDYVMVGGEKTLSKMTENHFAEPLVYVDPGHGGRETGTAHYNIVEKDLNLSISFKLRDRLEDYGYKVAMSRTDDSQVDLYDRPAEANRLGADIFVSVHNNAMPGSSAVHGIENYYYQYDESDSYKPQYKRGSEEWKKATSQLRGNESKRLTESIHNELIAGTGAVDRGTREMGFAVIRETFMPAVLLELGFVSNYNEAHRLNTDSYQRTLANSVIAGINNYFGL